MTHWVGPALRLGPPILSRPATGSLRVEREEPEASPRELDTLAAHWPRLMPAEAAVPRLMPAEAAVGETPLLEHLTSRPAKLREAVRIAASSGGTIEIRPRHPTPATRRSGPGGRFEPGRPSGSFRRGRPRENGARATAGARARRPAGGGRRGPARR